MLLTARPGVAWKEMEVLLDFGDIEDEKGQAPRQSYMVCTTTSLVEEKLKREP